jgi:hypothetical protein
MDSEKQITTLRKQSLTVTVYLIAVTLPAFFLGYFLLDFTNRMVFLLAVALIGFSGSGVAALTSCLDRYAKGFELEDGTKVPAEAKGETFNGRMLRWFYVRPFLGFLVGPVTIWGIEFLVKDASVFRDTTPHLAFSAFLGGLLAKSILDLIKGLFKNVFHS